MQNDDPDQTDLTAPVTDITGIDEEMALELRRAGYTTVDDLRAASRESLADVDGISTPLADHIKTDAGDGVTDRNGRNDNGTNRSQGDEDTAPEKGRGESWILTLKWYQYVLLLVTGFVGFNFVPARLQLHAIVGVFACFLVGLWIYQRQFQISDREPTAETPAQAGSSDQLKDRTDNEPHETTDSTTSPQKVHFEETLTYQGNKKKWQRVAAIILGLFVVPVGLMVVQSVITSNYGDAVIGVAAVVVAIGLFYGVIELDARRQAHVQVTETGVEVRRNFSLPWTPSGVFIPFVEIKSVQYSEASDPPIEVTKQDHRTTAYQIYEKGGLITQKRDLPQAYMVNQDWSGRSRWSPGNYPGGIRIGRSDKPPVYIGSARPKELATTITERAPSVKNPELL